MPQRVRLPNGKSFLAKHERVSKRNLLRNVTITKIRQIGPRNQKRQKQKGGSFFGNIAKLGANALTLTEILKKGLGIGVKALNSELGKKLVDEEIKHAQELYRLVTSKIKNQNEKRELESNVANYIAEEAQTKQLKTCLVKMAQGISNFQIEKAFENINDTDINNNFVGVFPANRMNRFINYKSIISKKRENIPL